MNDGQDAIYYMTGESRATIENSPHLEAFRAKGYEVLLLTDPVDEVWVDAVPTFEDKQLHVDRQGRGRPRRRRGEDAEPSGAAEKDFADLLTWMATTLADDVKEVRLSHRLTTSPACWSATPAT